MAFASKEWTQDILKKAFKKYDDDNNAGIKQEDGYIKVYSNDIESWMNWTRIPYVIFENGTFNSDLGAYTTSSAQIFQITEDGLLYFGRGTSYGITKFENPIDYREYKTFNVKLAKTTGCSSSTYCMMVAALTNDALTNEGGNPMNLKITTTSANEFVVSTSILSLENDYYLGINDYSQGSQKAWVKKIWLE